MSEEIFGYYYLVCSEEFQQNHDRMYDQHVHMIFQRETEQTFTPPPQLQWVFSETEYMPGQDQFIGGELVHVPPPPLPIYNPADYEGWSA